MPAKKLDSEAKSITHLIKGKIVKIARRNRIGELVIEFDDASRLFINANANDLEFSITGTEDDTVEGD